MNRIKVNTKSIVVIVLVVAVGLFLLNNVFGGSGNEQPVDLTQPPASGTAQPDTKASKPTPAKKPAATPSPLTSDQLSTKPGAIILLNPATGTRGSSIGVSGVGFDSGQTIDIYLQLKDNAQPIDVGYAQVDQGGSFGGLSFTIPEDFQGSTFTVVAQQHDGKKQASAKGQVTGSAVSVKLGTQVGKAGNSISVSAKGFAPNETVRVFFNSLATDPVATLKADSSGGLSRVPLTVPYGPVGDNSFIFIGDTSQSPVTVPFLMLSFYPTASISEYAAKADTLITFSGKDFGPNERVLVYLNSMNTPPVAVVQSDEEGSFTDAGGFVIPFELNGKNTLIFFGEQTQSAVTTGFDVLPYTPYAEPSTYGGQPGTSLTFYGSGFARNEIVRVYIGRGQGNKGKQVACFMSDDQGSIIGGSANYTVPANAQSGKLNFVMVGDKSEAEATATIQVMPAPGPVQPGIGNDEQSAYVCPFDQAQEQPSPQSQ